MIMVVKLQYVQFTVNSRVKWIVRGKKSINVIHSWKRERRQCDSAITRNKVSVSETGTALPGLFDVSQRVSGPCQQQLCAVLGGWSQLPKNVAARNTPLLIISYFAGLHSVTSDTKYLASCYTFVTSYLFSVTYGFWQLTFKWMNPILWNNQQMQLYAVKFIPLLGSLYMFRVFYTPIIRCTIFNCIYSHWYKP